LDSGRWLMSFLTMWALVPSRLPISAEETRVDPPFI